MDGAILFFIDFSLPIKIKITVDIGHSNPSSVQFISCDANEALR